MTDTKFYMEPNSGEVQSLAEWKNDGFTLENAELIEVVFDVDQGWVEA